MQHLNSFQNLSVVQIIERVLAEYAALPNLQNGAPFELRLNTNYPPRSTCSQYRESDLAFIRRIAAEEGIFFWFEQQGDVHQLIFADHTDAFPQNTITATGALRFHRQGATETEDSILEWQATRQLTTGAAALSSWDYKPASVQRSSLETQAGAGSLDNLLNDDYLGQYYWPNQDGAEHYSQVYIESLEYARKLFSGSGQVRGMAVGQWFTLTDQPTLDGKSDADTQFTLSYVRHQGLNNIPVNASEARSSGLHPELLTLADILADAQTDEGIYHNQFVCARRAIPYRPNLQQGLFPKPSARGVHTAIVTGAPNTEGEEIYTDRDGRVRVQFPWDRNSTAGNKNNSTEHTYAWVRQAALWAGDNWGAQHIPRIGQEVLIQFMEDDADRPLIIGRMYNGPENPNWHAPGTLAGIKTNTVKGQGHNRIAFDDTTGQVRLSLASTQQTSELNLGHLNHQQDNARAAPRGLGFELRTDAWGSVRAAQGMLITSQSAPLTAQALDNTQSQTQLAQASEQAKAQADLTQKHKATAAKSDAALKQHAEDLKAEGYTKNHLHLHGQAGVGISAQSHLQIHAGRDYSQTAAQTIASAAGEHLHYVVAKGTSIFNYQENSQIQAAKGSISIKQHNGPLQLAADKDVKVQAMSAAGTVSAANEIYMSAQGGYIKINGSGIEIHSPSSVAFKGAHSWGGGSSVSAAAPVLSRTSLVQTENKKYSNRLDVYDVLAGQRFDKVNYTARYASGRVEKGVLDEHGRTARFTSNKAEKVKILVGDDEWIFLAEVGSEPSTNLQLIFEDIFEAPIENFKVEARQSGKVIYSGKTDATGSVTINKVNGGEVVLYTKLLGEKDFKEFKRVTPTVTNVILISPKIMYKIDLAMDAGAGEYLRGTYETSAGKSYEEIAAESGAAEDILHSLNMKSANVLQGTVQLPVAATRYKYQ